MISDRDEHNSLTADARRVLADLERSAFEIPITRRVGVELGMLIGKGFAFRSHARVTITDAGREVWERVS